jgi:peptidoglycan/LPS O-acetylase OafA/YrhL
MTKIITLQYTAEPEIKSLTALRGLAALMVVLSHCLRIAERSYHGETPGAIWPLKYFDFGTFGVVLFFTLSGYTLYTSQQNKDFEVVRFFVRRLFRVFPVYVVSIPIYIMLSKLVDIFIGFNGDDWISEFSRSTSMRVLFEYITFTFNIMSDFGYINNVYWSLPVEFQFYLMFPFFLFLLRITPLVLAGASLLLIVISQFIEIDFITFKLAWQFALGMIIAASAPVLAAKISMGKKISMFFLAIAVVVFIELFPDRLPLIPGIETQYTGKTEAFYYGISAAILLICTRETDSFFRKPGLISNFLTFQGQISYSIYIWHNCILLAGYSIIIKFGLHGAGRSAIIYGLGMPLIYALSYLSYCYIEKPGIDLGKKLVNRRRKDRYILPNPTVASPVESGSSHQ